MCLLERDGSSKSKIKDTSRTKSNPQHLPRHLEDVPGRRPRAGALAKGSLASEVDVAVVGRVAAVAPIFVTLGQ